MKFKSIALSVAVIAALMSCLCGLLIWMEKRGFSKPMESSNPSHVLIVGLDSWTGYPNGLPDAIFLYELRSGDFQNISRTLSLGDPEQLGLGEYGEIFCSLSCTAQNAYSSGAAGDLSFSGISPRGLDALANALEVYSGIESLGVIAFDLIFARSAVTGLGELTLNVPHQVWIGPTVAGSIAQSDGYFLGKGEATLSGNDLYWFARSRYKSSDEERAARQQVLLTQALSQKSRLEIARAIMFSKGEFFSTLSIGDALRLGLSSPSPSS